ncbi:hypothetical protein SteCoe_30484 [Stentor coeruleus]|uniref:PH domain-containing protein n=1 Tax=Stentor coeruleus TaxID=5963 RepID=A0A1R2B3J1_9CILI|nr:hypothetical protein SteCoe_30484 [Stentor coeruleus]
MDIFKKAISRIQTSHVQSQEKESEEQDGLMTREDLMKKVKTLSETIKVCQKQRLKTFFSPSALKSLLRPRVSSKNRKELRRSSHILSSKTLILDQDESQDSEVSSNPSTFSSESSSEESESANAYLFPIISLTYENPFTEGISAREDLDILDKEFAEKIKIKARNRSTSSNIQGNLNIFTSTGCRGYVKIIKEAYQDSDLIYSRGFLSISTEELQIFETAREYEPILKIPIQNVKEIIDPKDGKIFIIYVNEKYDKGLVIWPLTSSDYTRWSNTLKNISRIKGIIHKNVGHLPTEVEEEIAISPLRHKSTVFQKSSGILGDATLSLTIEELSLQSEEETSSKVETITERSWSFDFDKLDNDKSKMTDKDLISESDEEGTNNDEEKIRSLTMLAILGKSEGLVNLITKGGLFIKYGRWGKPHMRHVLVTGDLSYVEWWHINKNKASGHVIVINIFNVIRGRTTKNFKRFMKQGQADQSFSLICKDRTVDLEIAKDNKTPVDVWILAFESLIKQKFQKDQVVRYITKHSTLSG